MKKISALFILFFIHAPIYSSGVFPYYIDTEKKQAYVLIGKTGGKWSDFGGGSEIKEGKKETQEESAAREFSEETLGMYGTTHPETYAERIKNSKDPNFLNYYDKVSTKKIFPQIQKAKKRGFVLKSGPRYKIFVVNTGKFTSGRELYRAAEEYRKIKGSRWKYKEMRDFYWIPIDDLIKSLDKKPATFTKKGRYLESNQTFRSFVEKRLRNGKNVLEKIKKEARKGSVEPKQPTIFPKANDTALKNALEDLTTSLVQFQSLLEAN